MTEKPNIFFRAVQNCLIILLRIFFKFKNIDEKKKIIGKTANLYQGNEFISLFSKIRLWDSPIEKIDQMTSKKGTIVDLGCGDGITTNYLALASPKRNLIGVEINKDRVKYANKNLENTKFICADALKTTIPRADTIIMIHLLHHLPSLKDQQKLLENCFKSLKKSGELIIAEVDKNPFLKYIFSYFTDGILVPILFERNLYNLKVFYRSSKDWKKLLGDLGFSTKIDVAHQGKPFSHIIMVAQKK